MNKLQTVTVVVPTRNSEIFLKDCLSSVRKQSYPKIELIVVDNSSKDKTINIAKKYADKIFDIKSDSQFKGTFSASVQRNYGVKKAKGTIVYYFDADMVMPKNTIKECVNLIESGADAIIIPEDSFGTSFWARCKQLERRCYWGDSMVEAPRCLRKDVWNKLSGLDAYVAGGGDDWDLHEKLKAGHYSIQRTSSIVLHNEGHLSLVRLLKKRFMYGRDGLKYIQKRPKEAFISYMPIRKGFITNWWRFLLNPVIGLGTIYMRILEYGAGACGILYSRIYGNS